MDGKRLIRFQLSDPRHGSASLRGALTATWVRAPPLSGALSLGRTPPLGLMRVQGSGLMAWSEYYNENLCREGYIRGSRHVADGSAHFLDYKAFGPKGWKAGAIASARSC